MNILPYKLKTTNEQLTSRARLVTVAQIMEQLELSKSINHYFPRPKSNRGIFLVPKLQLGNAYLQALLEETLQQHFNWQYTLQA